MNKNFTGNVLLMSVPSLRKHLYFSCFSLSCLSTPLPTVCKADEFIFVSAIKIENCADKRALCVVNECFYKI